MKEIKKQFSINDIEIYREDDDIDFARVKIYAFADKNNSHKNPISTEVLKRDANTILGKFIVAKFDNIIKDTKGHMTDEVIVGYIDPRETVEFEEKVVDGVTKTFLVINGLLSKIYATDVVEMFRAYNNRTVSCEFSCIEDDENSFGDKEILSYWMHGITILGLAYRPSIKGTEIKVMKFAEEFSNKGTLKEFAEKRKKKVNKEAEMEEITKSFEEDKDFSEEETKELAQEEDIVMAEPKDDEPKEEEKQMEEPVKEDEKEEEEIENKEFSLDAYADVASTLAMLESETEKNQELAKKVMSEMTAQEIVLKFVEMSKEVDRLKAFESQIEEDKCTKKLSTIMASVKEDLDEDSFTEFAKEGKTLKFAELDAFENKVNAFA